MKDYIVIQNESGEYFMYFLGNAPVWTDEENIAKVYADGEQYTDVQLLMNRGDRCFEVKAKKMELYR